MKLGFSLALLFTVFQFERSLHADSISLNPVADAWIGQSSPDQNSGNDFSNVAGKIGQNGGNDVRRTLLRFDLSHIPQGAIINSATLTIFATIEPQNPSASFFDLHRILRPWTEGGVTWNSTASGVAWQESGATGPADSDVSPSASVFISGPKQQAPIPYTFSSGGGLIADVQAWANDPSSNFGWLLMSEDENTPYTARRFGSRDDVANTPVLRINFNLPSLGIATQPQSQTNFVGSTASFNVVAAGGAPFTYQWLFNGNPLPGQTSDTLTLDNIQTNQSGPYIVTVSNASGSTNSLPATLTVLPLPPGLPVVRITSPTNNAKFPVGANILFAADAFESNGTITQVQFFLGTNSVGVVAASPFSLIYSNAAAGAYSLRAEATDDSGVVGTSGNVPFSVARPPTVAITSPTSGSRFPVGKKVTVNTSVTPSGAKIIRADFFAARTNAAGLGQPIAIGSATNSPYSIAWVPASRGNFILTARATDELGQTGRSTGVLARVFLPELIPPIIIITSSPPDFSIVTASPIRLAGLAGDNIAVDHVEFQVVSGPFLSVNGAITNARGAGSWEAFVPLSPGQNLVRIRSVDQAQNKSSDLLRVFNYTAFGRLTMRIHGPGIIYPNLNNQLLQLGNIYYVQAIPAPGYIFSGWDGVKPGTNPTLGFEMKKDLVITANFIRNPFPAVAGAYRGLFMDPDTNRFRPEASGFVRLQVATTGAFSGLATLPEGPYPFTGHFDPHGSAKAAFVRHGLSPVAFSLQLDLTNGTDSVTGTATTAANDVQLTSPLLAKRNIFSLSRPPPQTGVHSFSLQLPSDPPVPILTGSATINPNGTVSVLALFGGTVPGVVSSAVAKDGTVPFYLSIASGVDVLAGWLDFSGTNNSETGPVFWVHNGISGVAALDQVNQ